jgi:hypothetical protein
MQLNILIDACHFQRFPEDTVLDLINRIHNLRLRVTETDIVIKTAVHQDCTVPVNTRGN